MNTNYYWTLIIASFHLSGAIKPRGAVELTERLGKLYEQKEALGHELCMWSQLKADCLAIIDFYQFDESQEDMCDELFQTAVHAASKVQEIKLQQTYTKKKIVALTYCVSKKLPESVSEHLEESVAKEQPENLLWLLDDHDILSNAKQAGNGGVK